MAGQFRLTPELMIDRASEYGNEADKVGEVIAKMDLLLQNLQDEWEGEASKAYAEKFEELRPGFVKVQELIQDISQYLKNTAKNTEQFDRDNAVH